MTEEEAVKIAEEVASEVVLHDLPKRLYQAGVSRIFVLALTKVAGPPLEESIISYLADYEVSE